jgi:hypothetical protein
MTHEFPASSDKEYHQQCSKVNFIKTMLLLSADFLNYFSTAWELKFISRSMFKPAAAA